MLRGLAAALREAGIRAGWPTDPVRLEEITALVARHDIDDLVAAAVQQDANSARTPGRTPAELPGPSSDSGQNGGSAEGASAGV